MALEKIKEFLTLANIGNLTEAAEQLYISHSTLSRHIRELEFELGVQLFTRTSNSVVLNEYGQTYLPYAQKIISKEKEYTQAFLDEIRRMHGQLSIGVFMLNEEYGYLNALDTFNEKHPDYNISFFESHDAALKDFILQGTCDFAIIIAPPRQQIEGVNKITISSDCLVAVLPIGHPLAKQDVIEQDQLKGESILLQGKSNAYYDLLAKERNLQVITTPYVLNTISIMKMVERGQGITVRPKQLAIKWHSSARKIADINPPIRINIDLIYRKDKLYTDAEKELIAFFQEHFCNK